MVVQLRTKSIDFAPGCSKLLEQEQFGVVVDGVRDINALTDDEFRLIEQLLYKHDLVVFENVAVKPEGQYNLTRAFDPAAVEYGHGNVGRPDTKSILHPDIRNIPSHPAVQLIGNGKATEQDVLAGLPNPTNLKHPSHETFHKSVLSEQNRAAGRTRFYRWHIDSAFYERSPPKVTSLYALRVPQGPKQTILYDDGTGDQLEAPLGGTAFASGKLMFDLLPAELKSLAVRTKVQYAPHPYVWMGPAKSNSLGLGLVSEGKERAKDDLPPWSEGHVKILPMLWKNPVTGALHLQIHPSCVESLIIDPVPEGTRVTAETMYPKGAVLTDLAQVRDLVYKVQRPAIAPEYVHVVDWKPGMFAIFHNRGVLHSITGSFAPDAHRAFWQCNLASTDDPAGPSTEDVHKWA